MDNSKKQTTNHVKAVITSMQNFIARFFFFTSSQNLVDELFSVLD